MQCDQQPGVPGTEIKERVSSTDSPDDGIESEATRKLQESEERYRALALACGQIVWTSTAEGLMREELSFWCAFTGQSPGEAQGWGWLDIVHPDDRERVRRIWLHAVATHTLYETEYRVRRHDGVYRDLLSRAVPTLGADGRICGWVGVCTDITERKQLEQMQRQSAREAAERLSQLEATFEAMAEGVLIYNAGGDIVRYNAAACKLLGIDRLPGDADGRPYTAYSRQEREAFYQLRDEDGNLFSSEQKPLPRMLQGEVLIDLYAHIRTFDGREVDVNMSAAPIRNADGSIVGGVSIFRDVTGIRLLERQTHRALNALLAMAEALVLPPNDVVEEAHIPAGELAEHGEHRVAQRLVEITAAVLGCRHVGIVAVEPGTERLQPVAVVGLSPKLEYLWRTNLPGTRLIDQLVDPEQVLRLHANKEVLLDLTRSLFNPQPGGAACSLLAVPMHLNGQLVGVFLLDRVDRQHIYTEEEIALARAVGKLAALVIEHSRLSHEWALARANELALRESSHRMDEFMSIASHELRTPLTAIKANIQLAERRIKKCIQNESMETRDRLEKLSISQDLLLRADQQVVVINRLVGDLLDVARIREDKFELKLHQKPCNLVMVVQEAVQEQQQIYSSRTISLELPAEEIIPVVADAVRLGQVVSNYLTNALKYSPPGPPVAVRLRIEGAVARVLVRDEGPGLPLQEQQRVWERFYQVRGIEAKTGSAVGLGLGLHITKMIINLHHGEVGVESTPGKGSTFWFTLPLLERGQV